MNALAQQISPMGPNGQKMVQPDRGGYSPQMEVSADPSQKPPIKAGPASSDIVIPFKGPNKPITYEVPVGSRKERLTVNFTDELTAMLSINNGPERPIRLKRPRDPLVIRLK
jgi:hypothetical protein